MPLLETSRTEKACTMLLEQTDRARVETLVALRRRFPHTGPRKAQFGSTDTPDPAVMGHHD